MAIIHATTMSPGKLEFLPVSPRGAAGPVMGQAGAASARVRRRRTRSMSARAAASSSARAM